MTGGDEERDEFGLLVKRKGPIPKQLPSPKPISPLTPTPKVEEQILQSPNKAGEPAQLKENGVDHKRGSVIVDAVGDVGSQPRPQVSEYSHLALVMKTAEPKKDEVDPFNDGDWQEMPAFASTDLYDDDGRLIAREEQESDNEDEGCGEAAKGYTRVNDDEDNQSVTSMDENTSYLFGGSMDDEASKTPLSQMQATKEMLTEGQRIAYVGVCRLAMVEMVKEQERVNGGKGRVTKKALAMAVEHTRMWAQKMIHRLYTHMDISTEGEF